MEENTSDEQLRLHIEAIERLAEEKKGIQDDMKDRFAIAKGEGFDVPVMKAVLARRAKERAELEQYDETVKLYEERLA